MLSSEIRSILENYIKEGETLLREYKNSIRQVKDVGSELGRDGLIKAAGLIASEVVPGIRRKTQKYSRKLLIAQSRMQLEQLEMNCRARFKIWFNNIKSFLSSISIQRSNLKYPGNSELLMRKLNRIYGYAKPDTKIRNTIFILRKIVNLPLIYNKNLPKILERKKPIHKDPYRTLKRLESGLRECIRGGLGKVTRNWWKERVPKDVQERAKLRINKNEKQYPWHVEKGLSPLFYIDFADYIKIITRRDNWRTVFEPIFKDKEIISAKLRELEPIRNAVAHVRELSRTEADKLNLYSKDIMSCIEKA
jgi:hypothetical protein